METTKADAISIYYRRGFTLYWAWIVLCVPAVLTAVFIAATARYVREEPGVYIALWAIVIFFALAVAAVTIPLIERFTRNKPAIIISSEGIKTRDMETRLTWNEIEKLTTRPMTSLAGRHTTTVNIFEICPKDATPSSFHWRKLVDAYANPYRIAWHSLADPERLRDALKAYALPSLLAKSDLAGLPDSRHRTNGKHGS